MKELTIIVLGEKYSINKKDNIEIIFANQDNFLDKIYKINSKYVTFIK